MGGKSVSLIHRVVDFPQGHFFRLAFQSGAAVRTPQRRISPASCSSIKSLRITTGFVLTVWAKREEGQQSSFCNARTAITCTAKANRQLGMR